ncbi:MAG: DUF1080 domain-containing protein [Verrucomicrobiales bacterium]|nr:DUF1080 domain-containing protein [Verrucomicrobiales bacterium]
MKKLALSFFSLALPFAFAADDEAGFIPIFNGLNLDGWDGVPGAWKVEEGAIVCTGRKDGGKNWLIWQGGEPADFELRLEFKFEAGNSGVQVRSHLIDDKPFHVQGYQIEIAQSEKMGLWHHSLSPEKYRSHLALAGEKTTYAANGKKTVKEFGNGKAIKKHCKDGEWNELVIIVKGTKLIQKINGHVFSELNDLDKKYKMKSGLIALQDHGKGTVASFRNIRLKPLD